MSLFRRRATDDSVLIPGNYSQGATRSLWWLLVLLALVSAWAAWLFVARGLPPSDGTRVTGHLFPTSEWRDGLRLHTIHDPLVTDLRRGDIVVEVDGEPVESWMKTHAGADFRPGQTLEYTVERAGAGNSWSRRSVAVELHRFDWRAAARRHAAILVLELALLATSLLVVSRRGRDPAARVLFAVAVVVPFGFPAWPLRAEVLDLTLSPWPMWTSVVAGCAWALVWASLIPHFALVFPRPPQLLDRRPWIVPALYAAPIAVYGTYLAVTLPQATNGLERLERVTTVSTIPERLAPLVVVGLMWWSYARTRDSEDRKRIALVATSLIGVFGLNFLWAQLPELVSDGSLVLYPYNTWIWVLCPLAIAVAVLRHHLFDITVVLRRSVIGLSLAGSFTTAYIVGLWAVSGGRGSRLLALLCAALVAVSLLEGYRWARSRVERRLYGARSDPAEVVELLDRVETGDDAQLTLDNLARTLGPALRLAYVAITLSDQDDSIRAVYGNPSAGTIALPLTREGKEIGRLEVAVTPGREPFGTADQRLLAAVAAHTAATVHTARLNSELQRSRARLLVGREEERRRIRRDLHDGVGATLALLAMNLEVAKESLPDDSAGTAELLDQAVDRAHEAITDVRRAAADLRPAVLDELGLVGAVRLLAERIALAQRRTGSDFEVTVEADEGIEPLPAAVEVAAFHIVGEALTNVSRHAGARHCGVRIARSGTLELHVVDDGRGVPANPAQGSGISSIRARAGELGGSADVRRASAAGGTLIVVSLPLDPLGAADGA